MSTAQYTDLAGAIEDDRFTDVDLALRRGRHIDRQDDDWYAYLLDAQAVLEAFYRRYGCELVHRSDGYFFLLPTTDQLPRRQLSTPDMLVGQAVALLYLEPASVESGGVVTRETVLAHLATVLGSDALMRAFNPKKRRLDERVAQQTVRTKVGEGLRRLAALGFVEALEGEALRLRPALMRFAEPVRTADSPAAALAKLLASGEVVLEAEDADAPDIPDAPDASDIPDAPGAPDAPDARAAGKEADDGEQDEDGAGTAGELYDEDGAGTAGELYDEVGAYGHPGADEEVGAYGHSGADDEDIGASLQGGESDDFERE